MALQREARLGLQWVERGGRAGQVAGADGQDAAARPEPGGHPRVLGLGGLDHEPGHRPRGAGQGLEQVPRRLRLPRAGRAADERVAVEGVVRNPQFIHREQGLVQDGAQHHVRRAADSGVTSNRRGDTARMPGSSRAGGRATDARNSELAMNGDRPSSVAASAPRHRASVPRSRPGVSTYGTSSRSLALHSRAAVRCTPAASSPPTRIRTDQTPAVRALVSSR